MSTYWRIECLDCDGKKLEEWESSESGDGNHAEEKLADFLRARAEIDALAATDAFWHIDYVTVLGIDSGPDPLHFVAAHKGHKLAIVSEYGDIYDWEKQASGDTDG